MIEVCLHKILNDSDFSLSKLERESIWVPEIGFTNALGPVATVGAPSGILIRQGNPLKEDISLANEGKGTILDGKIDKSKIINLPL